MAHSPRILQICHDEKGPFGTIARQYALGFADCEIHTVFLRGPTNEALAAAIPGEVTFLQLESGELRGLKFAVARRLREQLKGREPDIIIAHRYKPFFIALLLNYQLELTSVVGVMHEFGFLRRWTRSVFSRFWPDNVFLIGVSEALVDDVAAHHRHLRSRLFAVPHAVEGEPLVDAVTARQALGIPLGVYCFGTVGRLVRKKDHELLIKAFSNLPGDSVLAIVGDGVLLDALKLTAAGLGIESRVIFCGAHPNAKIYYKAFDVFVLSSTHEEAFGMVLLEAMAASVPVICSDAPGPVSVIGDAGIVFKAGDADDLNLRLGEMQQMSPTKIAAQVSLGIERLESRFTLAAVRQRLRAVPAFDQLTNRARPVGDKLKRPN